jgi:hypothetical protein
MAEDEELSIARAALDAAFRQFVRVKARVDHNVNEDVLVTGWAGFAEYTTRTYMQEDVSGNVVAVPNDQTAATARGLFEFGVDAFSRRSG